MSMHTPKYRLHRSTGQAVVTLNGRDLYLGKYGSTESKIEYDRLIAEWFACTAPACSRGRCEPPSS